MAQAQRSPTSSQLLLKCGILAGLLLAAGVARGDLIELLSGAKVEGEVVARDQQSITIKTTIGGREFTRKWPLERVHAVTIQGKREVIQAKNPGDSTPGKEPPSGKEPASGPAQPGAPRRTRAEIEALIEQAGRAPPEWWDSVALNYPTTLDLSWPAQPPGGWNNQRNVGQYLWDVVNPNPNKWREGIRLVHHILTINKDNPQTQQRAMNQLARMYQSLLHDYARAAFWWRRAGVDHNDRTGRGVDLAECYWRLGNKQMATELLEKLPPQFHMIKLWADMGELRRALQLADPWSRGAYPDVACIYAGDACRVAGQYAQALQYYQQLLKVPATGQGKGRIERNHRRASANIEAIKLFDTLDLRRVPDGTYRNSSLGYEAQVHVEVVVKAGRIESVRVTDHREKQYYSAMTDTPQQIIEKQDLKGIDATSGATITAEAIINATAKALSAAMQ